MMRLVRRRRERGFSIVTAIFLLVVLAGLGVAMVNLSSVQHTSAASDLQGVRAYHAARSGIEWGLHRALRSSVCTPAPTTLTFPAPSMTGITVVVTCTASPSGVRQLRAIACNRTACPGPDTSADYVEREVMATF